MSFLLSFWSVYVCLYLFLSHSSTLFLFLLPVYSSTFLPILFFLSFSSAFFLSVCLSICPPPWQRVRGRVFVCVSDRGGVLSLPLKYNLRRLSPPGWSRHSTDVSPIYSSFWYLYGLSTSPPYHIQLSSYFFYLPQSCKKKKNYLHY